MIAVYLTYLPMHFGSSKADRGDFFERNKLQIASDFATGNLWLIMTTFILTVLSNDKLFLLPNNVSFSDS